MTIAMSLVGAMIGWPAGKLIALETYMHNDRVQDEELHRANEARHAVDLDTVQFHPRIDWPSGYWMPMPPGRFDVNKASVPFELMPVGKHPINTK